VNLVVVSDRLFDENRPIRTTAKLSPSRVVLMYNAERFRCTCSNAAITAGCSSVSGSESILSAKSGTHAHAAKESRYAANTTLIFIVGVLSPIQNYEKLAYVSAKTWGF
jgi:hypothetical protein